MLPYNVAKLTGGHLGHTQKLPGQPLGSKPELGKVALIARAAAQGPRRVRKGCVVHRIRGHLEWDNSCIVVRPI